MAMMVSLILSQVNEKQLIGIIQLLDEHEVPHKHCLLM